MDKNMVERFWEHPTRFILGLFLAVTVLCTLLTIMPKWFNVVCGIFLLGGLIVGIKKMQIKEKKGHENTQ